MSWSRRPLMIGSTGRDAVRVVLWRRGLDRGAGRFQPLCHDVRTVCRNAVNAARSRVAAWTPTSPSTHRPRSRIHRREFVFRVVAVADAVQAPVVDHGDGAEAHPACKIDDAGLGQPKREAIKPSGTKPPHGSVGGPSGVDVGVGVSGVVVVIGVRAGGGGGVGRGRGVGSGPGVGVGRSVGVGAGAGVGGGVGAVMHPTGGSGINDGSGTSDGSGTPKDSAPGMVRDALATPGPSAGPTP